LIEVPEENYTEQIVEYAQNFEYGYAPEKVVNQTKYVILDTLGVMLAASNQRYLASNIIAEFVKNQGGCLDATVVGRGFKTSSVNAALVNGTFGYLCDLDTHHIKAILHEAAVLIPSALAVGEKASTTGENFVGSIILGMDVETRLSLAISPTGMYARGFHPSVVAGSLGSAMVSGKIIDLDKREYLNALGLAGNQSSTLLAWENDETEMSRPFGIGVAARNGVTAALLAKMGFGGPELLQGKYTVFKAFSDEAQPELLLDELGERFDVMNLAFKKYSSCSFTHPGLDAFLSILEENSIRGDEITGINVRFPTTGAKLIDGSKLKSHNIQYVLSVAAYKGGVFIDDILFEQQDKRIWELSKRVNMVYDDDLDKEFPIMMPTIIEVVTGGGNYEKRVNHAKGTPENPMSFKEITEKFFKMATMTTDKKTASKIYDTVMNLERINNINVLAKNLIKKKS
jgi:2-methylcitrate dehydratase PrpD